jgi:hypothetical protein
VASDPPPAVIAATAASARAVPPRAGDERDAAPTEVEQVLGGEAGARRVVDHDRGGRRIGRRVKTWTTGTGTGTARGWAC